MEGQEHIIIRIREAGEKQIIEGGRKTRNMKYMITCNEKCDMLWNIETENNCEWKKRKKIQ